MTWSKTWAVIVLAISIAGFIFGLVWSVASGGHVPDDDDSAGDDDSSMVIIDTGDGCKCNA